MGIALWIVSSVAAFLVARLFPWRRGSRFIGELLLSMIAGFLLGIAATALDFGGWKEPDWRAGLFVLFGTLAVAGAFRLTIGGSPGGRS